MVHTAPEDKPPPFQKGPLGARVSHRVLLFHTQFNMLAPTIDYFFLFLYFLFSPEGFVNISGDSYQMQQ